MGSGRDRGQSRNGKEGTQREARGHTRRGLRRPRSRVARGDHTLLRDALEEGAGDHKGRAGVLPGYPWLLAGDDRLRGEVPLRVGGHPHGPLSLPDARGSRRDPRGHRRPLPRPFSEDSGDLPGGLRLAPRPRLQRLAPRGVVLARERPARVHPRCPQDPVDAAREIEKYSGERGMVGVFLPCAGLERLWGHRQYDPIYEAAQEADLPVLMHSVTVIHPVFPFNTQGFETEFGRHICSHTFSMMANIVHMITTGVPVRYPDLRVAVTEAGISWVPFLMHKMDKEYIERRREVPFLEDKPSTYLKKMYFATQPVEEPENLSDLVTMLNLYDGEDNTIFASDWPHHDFDHPSKVHQIPFTNEVRRKVFGENALRLLNIDSGGNRLEVR